MSEINPTPWTVAQCPCEFPICDKTILDANGEELYFLDPETIKLIAAAPKLLEGLGYAVDLLLDYANTMESDSGRAGILAFIKECDAVIKKARGET